MSGNFLSLAARRAEPENRRSAESRWWLPECRIFHPERGVPISGTHTEGRMGMFRCVG